MRKPGLPDTSALAAMLGASIKRLDLKAVIARQVGIKSHFMVMKKGLFVAVVDLNDGSMSVTNDAEKVIDYLREIGDLAVPGTRVVYRDSEKRWDEMKIKDGRFDGFNFIGAMTPDEAIAILTRGAH